MSIMQFYLSQTSGKVLQNYKELPKIFSVNDQTYGATIPLGLAFGLVLWFPNPVTFFLKNK